MPDARPAGSRDMSEVRSVRERAELAECHLTGDRTSTYWRGWARVSAYVCTRRTVPSPEFVQTGGSRRLKPSSAHEGTLVVECPEIVFPGQTTSTVRA